MCDKNNLVTYESINDLIQTHEIMNQSTHGIVNQ